ncbi:MAG: hypothetical protein ACLSA6_14805 [Holdemania massiliensis]
MPIGVLEWIKNGGLVLYACFRAFLPLPLEVVLIPLILKNPEGWLLYALEGAVGTTVGGWIGYQIATPGSRLCSESLPARSRLQPGKN